MIDQIETKNNMISLAISDHDKKKLTAISNDYSVSYTIRHLIRKSFIAEPKWVRHVGKADSGMPALRMTNDKP